jgi:hypothetical protein
MKLAARLRIHFTVANSKVYSTSRGKHMESNRFTITNIYGYSVVMTLIFSQSNKEGKKFRRIGKRCRNDIFRMLEQSKIKL